MDVLFCHDGRLNVDSQNNYYGVGYNDETFRRYYTIADNLKVLMRVHELKKGESTSKLSQIRVSPFEVIRVPNISSISGQITNKLRAKNIIKNAVYNADYIVVRLPSVIGGIALSEAKKQNKKYVVEVVACVWDSLWNHSWKGKLVAPFQFAFTRYQVRNSQSVIYITNQFLQSRYPTKGNRYICPNVSLKDDDSNVYEKREKKLLDLRKGKKIIIGSVGAVSVKYKGHADMIKATKILLDAGYDVEYHVVGGGDQSRLKKLIANYNLNSRVILHGSLSHKEIFDFLDEVDIYVQPSLAEAQGRSLIEAMSRGCLCICTNAGGMYELLEPYCVAEKKDPDSLANRIEKVLSFDIFSVSRNNIQNVEQFKQKNIEEKRKKVFKQIFHKRSS